MTDEEIKNILKLVLKGYVKDELEPCFQAIWQLVYAFRNAAYSRGKSEGMTEAFKILGHDFTLKS